MRQADADSARAVALDERDALAWALRGIALGYLGKFDAAFAAFDRAQSLDPSRFFVVEQRGWLQIAAGRPADALTTAESLRIVAGADSLTDLLPCTAHLALGAYAVAVRECERAAAAEMLAHDRKHLLAGLRKAGVPE
jgi:Flp pilus assembly protein TadD